VSRAMGMIQTVSLIVLLSVAHFNAVASAAAENADTEGTQPNVLVSSLLLYHLSPLSSSFRPLPLSLSLSLSHTHTYSLSFFSSFFSLFRSLSLLSLFSPSFGAPSLPPSLTYTHTVPSLHSSSSQTIKTPS
jgi:hypothetical protein